MIPVRPGRGRFPTRNRRPAQSDRHFPGPINPDARVAGKEDEMKEYKTGDSICFKKTDGEREFGTVRFELVRDGEGVFGYEVETEAGHHVVVRPGQVVDFEEISRLAGEALDRWHAEDRRKAYLLSELLGRLGYYADRDGRVEYLVDGRWQSSTVSGLVAEFKARRDAK